MASRAILRKWRLTLWRWHRRVGITAFSFLAVMAATGIILNHADGWRLYDTRLPYSFAGWAYGDVGSERIFGVQVEDKWLYHKGTDLIFDQRLLSERCEYRLNGMVVAEGLFWVNCGATLLGYTDSGEYVERITLELKEPTAVANCSGTICVLSEKKWVRLDLASLETELTDLSLETVLPEKMEFDGLPKHLKITPRELNVGRLVADLHSGALFGSPGRFLVDVLGFVVLFLSATGCYLWLGNRR